MTDRVRATNKMTGDVYEFEVEQQDGFGLATTTGLYFYADEWDFERLGTPLPTKAGLYQASSDVRMNKLMLTTHGEWYWLDFTAVPRTARKATVESIQERYAATITPLYLYGEES